MNTNQDQNSQTTQSGRPIQTEQLSTDTNPRAKRANASAPQALPRLDFTRRQANRQLTTPQLLQLLHNEAPDLWQIAKVVGRWVWITFPQQPSRQVTGALSTFGFSWNKARRSWQHPCGDNRTRAASYDPRRRYGSRPAAQLQIVNGGQDDE